MEKYQVKDEKFHLPESWSSVFLGPVLLLQLFKSQRSRINLDECKFFFLNNDNECWESNSLLDIDKSNRNLNNNSKKILNDNILHNNIEFPKI